MREVISSGNSLSALAAFDVGCKFFGGYPITPSSEVMHDMSRLLPKVGGKFIQMEDEIGGISAALGASMSGVVSMTATSGPGISLKSEQIGLGYMAETPIVIVDVMRGGPSTGLPTRVQQGDVAQVKSPTHGDVKSITLCPGSLAETYTETVRAFNLAERFMQPIFVLLDETLGHMHGKAILPELEDVKLVPRKEFTGAPEDYKPYEAEQDQPAILNPMFKGYKYHITGLHHNEIGFPTEDEDKCQLLIERLLNKVDAHYDEIESYEEYMLDDADEVIIAYGSLARSVKDAVNRLRKEGRKIGMFRPITLWPSPVEKLKSIGAKFDKILVTELNMGQYSDEIERTMKKDFETLFKANGRPISPSEIMNKVKGAF